VSHPPISEYGYHTGEYQNDVRSLSPSRFDAHFFFLKNPSVRSADVYIDISMQGSDAETNSARDFYLKLQRKN
jgi:hypothetical protein